MPNWREFAAGLPFATKLAWGGVAAWGLMLVGLLAAFWGANPAYADRFLVLLGAGWAAWESRTRFASTPPSPRPISGTLLLLVAAMLLPLGAYFSSRFGPRTLVLWWTAGGCVLAAGGLLIAGHGVARLRVLAFPLLFVPFALPIPSRVLGQLQSHLQEWTTSASFAVLSTLGYAVERAGVVLRLPGGDLGVAEACSGVRSVTAITALAAFVAFLRGFGPIRGVVIVFLAIPVVAAVNVGRVVGSGWIQETLGAEYVRGNWHESLGVAMVFVGLGLVLVVASCLGSAAPTESPRLAAGSGRRISGMTAAVVGVGVLATVAAFAFGLRAERAEVATAPLEEIPFELGPWTGTRESIPESVTEILRQNEAIYRVYTNNVGRQAYVWVTFWSRFRPDNPHDPDICWPNRGYELAERWKEPVRPGVTATGREYRRGPDRQFLVYWMQEGNEVVADPDAPPLDKGLFEHRGTVGWLPALLADEEAYRPRLMVLVAIPHGGAAAKRDAVDLAGRVGAELHRVCPWAEPNVRR